MEVVSCGVWGVIVGCADANRGGGRRRQRRSAGGGRRFTGDEDVHRSGFQVLLMPCWAQSLVVRDFDNGENIDQGFCSQIVRMRFMREVQEPSLSNCHATTMWTSSVIACMQLV